VVHKNHLNTLNIFN
jgi:hypothetical protein